MAAAEAEAPASAEPSVVEDGPAADTVPAAPEEPKTVLLWRPARNENRFRNQRPGARDGAPQGRRDRGRGNKGRDAAKPEDAAPKEPKVLWRADDPQFQRKPRPEGERDNRTRRDGKPHEGKRSDGRPERKFENQARPREEKPRPVDPDSPFAKLAALRDQLRK